VTAPAPPPGISPPVPSIAADAASVSPPTTPAGISPAFPAEAPIAAPGISPAPAAMPGVSGAVSVMEPEGISPVVEPMPPME